jgi:hypothetical protein
MSTSERFWELICGYSPAMLGLLWLYTALFALLLFALVFLPPDSGAFVIAIFDVFVLGVPALVVFLLYRHCRNR